QTLTQNLIAKYGYDNTRKWHQGIVESIIGGAGLGGPAGAVSSQFNANSPQVQQALAEGMDPKDIAKVVKSTEDDIAKYSEHITAKAPKDMFESSGVKGENVSNVGGEKTAAGNVGAVGVDEVSPFYGEKTEDQLFMEQPIESGILPAQESAAAFEQAPNRDLFVGAIPSGLTRPEVANIEAERQVREEDVRQSPQGSELLNTQLAEEQQAGKEWMQAPIESGVLPAEESAAAFEAEEAQRTKLADMSQEEQFTETRQKMEEVKK
ncbi:unnamed protein product, partial [marine sediment metagenome]